MPSFCRHVRIAAKRPVCGRLPGTVGVAGAVPLGVVPVDVDPPDVGSVEVVPLGVVPLGVVPAGAVEVVLAPVAAALAAVGVELEEELLEPPHAASAKQATSRIVSAAAAGLRLMVLR
jgi:hypothetical protein